MDPQPPLILPSAPAAQPAGANGVPAPRTRLDLPWPTAAKAVAVLVGAGVAAHLVGLLTPILLQVLVALLITAALTPPVNWLIAHGVPRPGAVAVVMGGIGLAAAGLLLLVAQQLVSEGRALATALPGYVDRAQGVLSGYPQLNQRLRAASASGAGDPGSLLPAVLTAGGGVFTGLADAVAVVAMAAYLLAGGERGLGYVMNALSPSLRAKTRRAAPDIVHVVGGYLLGQAVTSLAFGLFAFAVLRPLGVPQPLLLALLAAILDAVPIVGVLVATSLPVLLALTVSQPVAVAVLAAFLVYHQVESHVLVPRIYGRMLGISSLAVLVAVLVGYRLLGILGVLIALPLAAAVPAVRSAWRQEELLAGTGLHLPPEKRGD